MTTNREPLTRRCSECFEKFPPNDLDNRWYEKHGVRLCPECLAENTNIEGSTEEPPKEE